ncbi:amidohydrolase [Aerococcus sanguinicola]|uniref:amidohydrolase n=1 Tax=unclassified Aerococcus TaxID=2618060 RepID=UPI0008A58E69|nr:MULTISPECIES: amidohydrolase [unclassified Aerococcus]KAB0645967.1 amidohydrolase [Aerococcus sanguinicola]MDK6234250.1 amidohydrolase [Aerococcus sp. UMB10185]MDK6855399.1 amidohydrolase [Aerococcus sp. UMB7533]OFN05489.1 hypothetical protein HMPREF2626_03195 [Aerococcus sp. HMSC062A02]OHO44841.1 hypothetical protein HMPREF2705_06460 [Aerococcus sp. HMSC035B07]
MNGDLEALLTAVDDMEEDLIQLRRDFHQYPETAWLEFRTTSQIITYLEEAGIPVHFGPDLVNPDFAWGRPDYASRQAARDRAIDQGADPQIIRQMAGFPGAIAQIDTGRPGPHLAFRFDIDANDLHETLKADHFPNQAGFRSKNPDAMHGCGHDGHTAIGLVLAKLVHRYQKDFCGKISFIFQIAEEGVRGARAMVEAGVLEGVDYLLACHILKSPENELAFYSDWSGLYATSKFNVSIHGRSAHAGLAPESGHNAILAATSAIANMNMFFQDSHGNGRLNIGTINGGTGRNVIPDFCYFEAETRGPSREVNQHLYDKAVTSIRAACEIYDCQYELEIVGGSINAQASREFAEKVYQASKAVPDFDHSYRQYANRGATDDFAYMMQAVQDQGGQATYAVLACPLAAGNHNDAFDFDEACLKAGAKAFLSTLYQTNRC